MSTSTATGATYAGDIARQELMALSQYAASPTFMDLGCWKTSGSHDSFTCRGPVDSPIEDVNITVVAHASRDKAYLGTNGTFNPSFADPLRAAKGAKWQLSLERPSNDVHFSPDWDVAVAALKKLQVQIAKTSDHRHFVIENDTKIRLGCPIWEVKGPENDTPAHDELTRLYPINRECAQWWDIIKDTHQIALLPVYGVDEVINTRPETWDATISGGLVEVSFNLKHYHMGPYKDRKVAYDVFSATILSITVLKKPAPIIRSPFKQNVSPTKRRMATQSPYSGRVMPLKFPVINPAADGSSTGGSSTASNPTTSTSGLDAQSKSGDGRKATADKGKAKQVDNKDGEELDDEADHPSPTKRPKTH